MKIDKLDPMPMQKLRFSHALLKSVPQVGGCYVLTTFSDDVLYIGLTDNLQIRFKKHINSPEKTNPTNEGRAIWFYFMSYDPVNLPKLERTWLNQFSISEGRKPILNKIDSPIS